MKNNNIKTYFIESNNVENLQTALGVLLQYAKFLEDETGRSSDSYADFILKENNVSYSTELLLLN